MFLAPPSWAALVSRLAGRGSEPAAVQERRLALAQAELDASGEFDVVVVNDDVARAADELVGLLTRPRPASAGGSARGVWPRSPPAASTRYRTEEHARPCPE